MDQELKFKKSKKNDSKFGAVVILVISAIVFLPAGGTAVYQSLFAKKADNVYGSYNGKKIVFEPGSKFYNEAARYKNFYESVGISINEEQYFEIMRTAFNQTLVRMAYSEAVEKTGWAPSKDSVNREIVKQYFMNPQTNTFDKERYETMDPSSLTSLRKTTADDMVFSRYASDLFGTYRETFSGSPLYGIKSNSKENDFFASMDADKHSFDMVSFSTADFPEDEALRVGKAFSEKFARYDMSVITLSEESEAKELLKRINAGQISFEDAVTEKSTKLYSDGTGKMTNSFYYQLSSVVEKEEDVAVLVNLPKGSLSDVISTKNGYSIFRTDGNYKDANFNDRDTIDTVVEYVKANEQGAIEEYFTQIAENFANEASISSFETACRKFNVSKTEIPAFPLNYGSTPILEKTTDSDLFSRFVKNEHAIQSAFALRVDEISSPLVIGSNVVVFKCTGIQHNATGTVSYESKIKEADQQSASAKLMASDKVKNDFLITYLKHLSSSPRRD